MEHSQIAARLTNMPNSVRATSCRGNAAMRVACCLAASGALPAGGARPRPYMRSCNLHTKLGALTWERGNYAGGLPHSCLRACGLLRMLLWCIRVLVRVGARTPCPLRRMFGYCALGLIYDSRRDSVLPVYVPSWERRLPAGS